MQPIAQSGAIPSGRCYHKMVVYNGVNPVDDAGRYILLWGGTNDPNLGLNNPGALQFYGDGPFVYDLGRALAFDHFGCLSP